MKMLQITFIVILLWSCKTDDNDGDITAEEEFSIAGNYSGTWSSTNPLSIYENIPASMRLQETTDPNKFSGQFYFTSNFTSCCNSGENDGSINMVVNGNQIVSFTYNDIIPNCNGSFSGTGTISDNGGITINFTGNDCEGDHSDGLLQF